MSDTRNTLVEHVKKLNETLSERKTYLTQVHDNIKQLEQEAKNVDALLIKIGGAIEAYNDSISLIGKEEGSDAELSSAETVEAEVVEAEDLTPVEEAETVGA